MRTPKTASLLLTALALALPLRAQDAPDLFPDTAAPAAARYADAADDPLNAVVKLEVTRAFPNIYRPWITLTGSGSGSGAVIAPGLILTCAHCVADASYIRVRKHNGDALHHAELAFIDNDADLALVRVEDPAFMDGVTPMELGETPRIQDEVLAVGYPIGGTDISFTRGIVSRIEDIVYTHAHTELLGVQIDAAINPGNSGGPVLDLGTGLVAGIAFQGDKKGEALGYMIPAEIIRHFLADIEDGRVDGFPDNPFEHNPMESPAMRRWCGMQDDWTGVLVEHVAGGFGGTTPLQPDDIILEIGGHKVSNNGKIRIAGNQPRSLHYPIYLCQIGEEIPIRYLRGGAVSETVLRAAKRDIRIRPWLTGAKPDYLLFGGIVFTTASFDYIDKADPDFHDDLTIDKAFPGDEAVVISDILPDVCMEGYLGCDDTLVRSVNGTPVQNLRHLASLIEASPSGYLRFGLDMGDEWDVDMVVDVDELRAATPRVMTRYQIPSDRSSDLLPPSE
jgi:S1-C subfamily serine protease